MNTHGSHHISPLPYDVNENGGSGAFYGRPGAVSPDGLSQATSFSLTNFHMTMDAGLYLGGGGSLVNSTLTMGGYPAEIVNSGTLNISHNSILTTNKLAGPGSIFVDHSTLNVLQSAGPYNHGGPPVGPQNGETITLTSAHLNIGTGVGSGAASAGMQFITDVQMDRASTITLNSTHATFENYRLRRLDLYRWQPFGRQHFRSQLIWSTDLGDQRWFISHSKRRGPA